MTLEVISVSALAIVSAGAIYASYKDTRNVSTALSKVLEHSHVNQLLGVVVIVAHASEIGRVVSHLTWWHAILATALFAVWVASKGTSGTEIA